MLTEAREDRVGFVTLSVHQAIDTSLQAMAQGGEHDRHEAGGRERDQQVAPHLQERRESAHRQNVEPDDARREGTVDEGAVYDEVYVEQVVAQDGDADAQGDEQQSTCHDQLRGQVRDQRARRRGVRDERDQRKVRPQKGGERRRDAEDHPLDLLPLHRVRGTPVAMGLRVNHRSQRGEPDGEREVERPVRRIRSGPFGDPVFG
jgi:hypothetical protein